jgi:arabinan endo-1,5-alpha-L-arabinosidase
MAASLWAAAACSSEDTSPPETDASAGDASPAADASRDATLDAPLDAISDASPADDGAASDARDASACTTRVSYGRAWIRPAGHAASFDEAQGDVAWDGTCTDEGDNSFALLSNGWKPYFSGHAACTLALDHAGCAAVPLTCSTRVAYGSTWLAPANHPQRYDDVVDRVLWDGRCLADGAGSYATLSNGWAPHFSGPNGCAIALLYRECGGLYQNPVVPVDCPDPGVMRDGTRYILACTSGNGADAFPIRVSSDLVTWTAAGFVFPAASKPVWAQGDYWAPEIHRIGAGYVAYFTARHTDGKLAIGAATSSSPTGPFTDLGAPLAHDPAMGLIDPNEYEAPDGSRYLLWKEDGNAVGKPTPIHAQALAQDGRSLVGPVATLITNDRPWEGAVVEGPWLADHAGSFYLFYSGNSYANGTYAVGVARASSPLGPFTKAAAPIVVTNGTWVGPGHCSVVDTPSGDAYMIYHAWAQGHVNGPGDGRLLLVDRRLWDAGGWPTLPVAPSTVSLPMP